MNYEGIVYRPPSEAYSLIVQVTIGCAHNKCSFCNMYKDKKFRIKSLENIYEDLKYFRQIYNYVDKIFLADGDALIIPTETLKKVLIKIKELFPECKRITSYATPKDILRKTTEELKELKNLGLYMLYMGVESGSDNVLSYVEKGATAKEIMEAGIKAKDAGFKLSATLISGLGGRGNWKEHAVESAKVINAIKPDYLGLLTLMVESDTKLYEDIHKNNFSILNPEEVMLETRELIKNLNVDNCIFRSNHASNYVSLRGTLCEDKENLLNTIDKVLEGKFGYKQENYRSF